MMWLDCDTAHYCYALAKWENTSTASHAVRVEEKVYNSIEKYVLDYTFKPWNLKKKKDILLHNIVLCVCVCVCVCVCEVMQLNIFIP